MPVMSASWKARIQMNVTNAVVTEVYQQQADSLLRV